MTLWRDTNDAWAVVSALGANGPIRAEIFEKDYWVTQVLRSLTAENSANFVFKGGTSLSKAFHCIHRFSEDVDILILKQSLTNNAVDELMKQMAERASMYAGLTSDPDALTRGRGTHRNQVLRYSSKVVNQAGLLAPTIQLEMGVRGSNVPSNVHRGIRPMIADRLESAGLKVDSYEDLSMFEVPVLHPGRTLIEKLLLLHHFATTDDAVGGTPKRSPTQIGRHFHDVHMLLELSEVQSWLEDRESFHQAVVDHVEVCRIHFRIHVAAVPEGGFSMSPAFSRSSSQARLLKSSYEAAMKDLYIGEDDFPVWDEVIRAVQLSAHLL